MRNEPIAAALWISISEIRCMRPGTAALKTVLIVFIALAAGMKLRAQEPQSDAQPDLFNYGSLFCIGPEVNILYPQQYAVNFEYRLWLRSAKEGRKYGHDHCFVLSPGYALLLDKSMLRLRAGDLIRLPFGVPSNRTDFRVGALAEYLVGNSERFLNLNVQFGVKANRMYYYAGASLPLKHSSEWIEPRKNIQLGFVYILSEKYGYLD